MLGFQCQNGNLKKKIFLIGKCASKHKNTKTDNQPYLDACATLLNPDGTLAWGENKHYIRSPKTPTYSFLNGGVEAEDGSYLLAFGHTDNVRTIIKIDPASTCASPDFIYMCYTRLLNHLATHVRGMPACEGRLVHQHNCLARELTGGPSSQPHW